MNTLRTDRGILKGKPLHFHKLVYIWLSLSGTPTIYTKTETYSDNTTGLHSGWLFYSDVFLSNLKKTKTTKRLDALGVLVRVCLLDVVVFSASLPSGE